MPHLWNSSQIHLLFITLKDGKQNVVETCWWKRDWFAFNMLVLVKNESVWLFITSSIIFEVNGTNEIGLPCSRSFVTSFCIKVLFIWKRWKKWKVNRKIVKLRNVFSINIGSDRIKICQAINLFTRLQWFQLFFFRIYNTLSFETLVKLNLLLKSLYNFVAEKVAIF